MPVPCVPGYCWSYWGRDIVSRFHQTQSPGLVAEPLEHPSPTTKHAVLLANTDGRFYNACQHKRDGTMFVWPPLLQPLKPLDPRG